MAAPVISASSSILGFRRNESFVFQPAATNSPVIWSAVGLPAGVSVETWSARAATGTASTDTVSSTAHGYADGDRVYFVSLTGGSGLTAGTIYYVRDKATDDFKLASVPGGAAVDFTTDISAAQVRKVSSGAISGACATAGVYVVTLSATNAAAETGTREFVIGIDSEAAPPSVDSGSLSADWGIDVVTREVTPPSAGAGSVQPTAPDAEKVLAAWKEGDTLMLSLRFSKGGEVLELDLDTLRLVLKEMEPEGALIVAEDFEKVGTGSATRYNLPVTLTGSALANALANYEADGGTMFPALAEIEWTTEVTHLSAPLTLKGSSQTFLVRIERDIAEG